MKYILIFLLLCFNLSNLLSYEPFYYRDENGKLRIIEDYPRDEFGNLVIDETNIIEILTNDSTLSATERMALTDSIFAGNNSIMERNNQLENIYEEARSRKDLSQKTIVIITAIIIGLVLASYLKRNKKK